MFEYAMPWLGGERERMKKLKKLAWLALLGFATAGLTALGFWPPQLQAQADANAGSAQTEKPAPPEAKPAEQFLPPDYVIGPDDTLHITVWKEPDMSATLPVRSDGKISLPLLDDVQAAGMTPLQLKDSIKEKLKKYISDPRVTVVVTAMNSRRIFVTGEVTHTGAMALLPNMTMLQALATSGFTQFANLKGIYLLRTENGQQVKLPFNYKEVVKGRHPEENIMLKPGDTIVVP
jgi:polysaccharide biosynthesis/export protein